MTKKVNLEPASFFMLRSNTLPIITKIDHAYNSMLFRDSIQIASPNLYKSLTKDKNELSLKEARHLENGLLKYFKRITYRPTPFGLFSAISVCKVEENNRFEGKKTRYTQGVTVDFEWFLQLIKLIEKNIICDGPGFLVQFNAAVLSRNSIYILDERSLYGEQMKNGNKSRFILRRTPLLDRVATLTSKTSISIEKLMENLCKNKKYTRSQYQKYLQSLIDNEFLVSELKPKIYDNKILDRLINKLEMHDSYTRLVEQLHQINKEIKGLEQLPPGEDSDELLKINEEMSKIKSVKNPLRIDLKRNFSKYPALSKSSTLRAVGAAERMFKILPNKPIYPWLSKYLEKFIERYGIDQVIPIKKVIDPVFGIGYPAGFLQRKTDFEFNHTQQKNVQLSYFDQRWQTTYLKGKISLNISNEDFTKESQVNQGDKREVPDSGEIYFQLLKSKNKLKKDKIIFNNLLASLNAGNTFGRFWYLLTENEKKEIIDFQNQANNKQKYEYVEISEVPLFAKNGNVMNNQSNLSNHLVLGAVADTKLNQVDLDDVYVGATLDTLYLYSKKNKKRWYFTSNSMLNFNYCSHLYRLLLEISLMNKKILNPIFLKADDIFWPRVEWNDVVLRLAQWHFNNDDSVLYKCLLSDKGLKRLREKYLVPRYVLLSAGDNQLPLDLENTMDKQILSQEAKNQSSLVLIEDYLNNHSEYDPAFSFDSKSYSTEIVLPFRNKTKELYTNENMSQLVNDEELDDIAQFLRKDWFYAEIALPDATEREVLKLLKAFMKRLKEKDQSIRWFFINYRNQDNYTIRFRIHSIQMKYGELKYQFDQLFGLLFKFGLVADYTLKRYIPEIYRYGGIDILDQVEYFFELDSKLAIEEIVSCDTKSIQVVNAFVNYYILRSFEISNATIRQITDQEVNQQTKINNRNLSKLIKNIYKTGVSKYFNSKTKLLLNKEVQQIKTISKLTSLLNSQRKMRMVNSLLHMHANRTNGINQDKEAIGMFLTNIIAKEFMYHES